MEAFTALAQSFWNKYRLEFIFLLIGFIILMTSLLIYAINTQSYSRDQTETLVPDKSSIPLNKNTPPSHSIYIDIAGAVVHPDVYKLEIGARLQDLIRKAGGLTDEADELYFARNFNQAQLLSDEEKVYIPSIDEIVAGTFTLSTDTSLSSQDQSTLVDINNATTTELESLSGVGAVTADKIVANRPYASIDELISKKVISQSLFNKIKDQISAQ